MSPVGIFETDGAGQCTYVNERWREIADLTPDQALELLRLGNEQFLTGGRTSVLTSSQRRLDLAAGQQPFAA